MGDLFDFFFFEPSLYRFNRATKDMNPAQIIEKDGKVFVLLNVLGVNKNDIFVEVKSAKSPYRHLLVVTGKTHNNLIDKDFSINISFVSHEPIKQIEWDTLDGLMTLTIEFNEPVRPEVKIIRK